MFIEFAVKVLATSFISVFVATSVSKIVGNAYGRKYKDLLEKYDDENDVEEL